MGKTNTGKSRIQLKQWSLLFILFFAGHLAKAQYCVPTYTYGCDDDMITNVSLIGESITLNNSTGCSASGYGDYTSLAVPDLVAGNTYKSKCYCEFFLGR